MEAEQVIELTDICDGCGHSFKDHAYNIPIKLSELDTHTDCKAIIGWYCPKCDIIIGEIRVSVIKPGIIMELKRTCPVCKDEVFQAQCPCCQFKPMEGRK